MKPCVYVELETLEDRAKAMRDRAAFVTANDPTKAVHELQVLLDAEAEDHPPTGRRGAR